MKVLIISHNPITTYQSMGKTMLSLFSSFNKDELCQLYIYPTVPDIGVCNSYFRVTDRDILKSFTRFLKVTPRVMGDEDIDTTQHSMYENTTEADFYKKNKKNSLTLICRDLMWSLSHWYNKTLKKWLAQEKPTCIFLAPGESKFIYNIALRIAGKLDIPVFTYICDDYYFVNKPEKTTDRLQLNLLKRRMKIALKKSTGIITICDELAKAYQDEFKTKAWTIFTGSNYPIADGGVDNSDNKGLTYMGNLTCNRYVTIAQIGRALDNINKENGTEYKLHLYAPPLKDEINEIFQKISSIQYCGYVTSKEFEQVLHSKTVLLHVEAFDEQSIDRVKHSVSTKIADSLGSGNLLFAYGPKQVASVRHLISHNCAIVVTEQSKLEQSLMALFKETDYSAVVKRAIATAKKYHSSEKNSLVLRDILAKH